MDKFEALRHFCSLAETLNFRTTAKQLAVSPQVVTRYIADLEQLLGEQLFKRNTRTVGLTAFGKEYLPQAQNLLQQSERLFNVRKLSFDEMNGVVRITLPPLLPQQRILSELLEKLEPYPNIQLEWRVEIDTINSTENQIDIGIRIGNNPDSNFIIHSVGISTEIIVASPQLLEKLGTPKDLQDLNHFPLSGILHPKTGRPWHWFINNEHQFMPKKPLFLTTDSQAELQACLNGRTISLLPKNLVQPYIEQGKLQIVFPELKPYPWQVYLYRPAQTVTSKRVLVVFEFLSGILKELKW